MEEGEKFIIADVGATKVLLFLARYETNEAVIIKQKEYSSLQYDSLENILSEFLEGEKGVYKAVIAIAGVIKDRKCLPTNLSWVVDANHIEKKFSFSKLILINDIELVGYSLSMLKKEDLLTLQKGGGAASKVKTVISVGTGLGEVIVDGDRVLPSEGGHADFASNTEEEIAFLQFMKRRHDHVSYERVLSGEGLVNVYEFFSERRDITAEEIVRGGGIESEQTLAFFLQTLGKEAGNLALKALSYGGVYLYGGVCQKNPLLLQREEFLLGFCNKGRFSGLLNEMPVYLIKTEKAALYGGLNLLLKRRQNLHK
jgi:glucokinase